MVRFEEAEKRLFRGIFICKKCKSKIRAPIMKVLQNKVACRKCGDKALRTVRRK